MTGSSPPDADAPRVDLPELAAVRPGEELDWVALEAYLTPRLRDLGLEVEGPMSVLQFPNGHANLTYLVRFEGSGLPVVVRRPPMGHIAPGAHDMHREYRVLSKLWPAYDRAPRAYLFCDDHDVIGSDFVASEYRTGVVVWGGWPAALVGLPDVANRAGLAVVDALADLHLVDPSSCGLGDLGRPEGYVQRQLEGWRKRWELVATPEVDETMTTLASDLAASRPESPAPTLLHNDFKMDNCQFDAGEPDRVASVFDWDMATLGDPLADVGMLLNYWPDPQDVDGDRPLHVPGMELMGLPPRSQVAEHYHRRTGAALDTITWYEAFASWKIAVVCQQLSIRFLRGESTDERMAQQASYPPRLARRARRILETIT